MGIRDIKDRIEKKAQSDADCMLDEARNESAEILTKAKEQVNHAKKKAWSDLNAKLDQQRIRIRAGAELEAEKMVLNRKKKLIESVYEEVRQKIDYLDQKTRKADLQKLLKRAEEELTVANVQCNKKDTGLLPGKKTTVAPIMGGLIAEEKSGKISVDLSYDSMLEIVRDKTAKDVAQVLLK